ncbi:MAG: response regulator [Phycisphaerae bacterium]|nr:response regulator [Phycisphaerae bacterium]
MNTIRASGQDLERLYDTLDGPGGGPNATFNRGFLRWPFRHETIRVQLVHPGGSVVNLLMACRNLSGGGCSVLHGSFVHVGTPCVVTLPDLTGKDVAITSSVVRCRHFRGKVHEVGIRFAKALNIRTFIDLDPLQACFTLEGVDAAKLTGNLLVIDDSPMDRRLIRHHLRDTGLNIVAEEDAGAALARVHEDFDMLIVDYDLPGMNGIEFIENLRTTGVQTPVIVISAGLDARARERMRELGVGGFLPKPLSREKLLRAIAEFLLVGGGENAGGALYSSLKPDDPSFGFVGDFLDELKELVGRLNKAIVENDAELCRRLCYQLRGSAPAVGFEPIGVLSQDALTQLVANPSVADCGKCLRDLVSVCLRARARPDPSPAAAPAAEPDPNRASNRAA